MISFEAGLLAVGGFIVWSPSVRAHEHHGVFLGAAAGIMFGVSDIAIKALTGAGGVSGILGSPWLAVTIVASVVAFYASASGLQKAEAVPVIALTSAAANVSAIAGGIIVFGDPMPSDALGIVAAEPRLPDGHRGLGADARPDARGRSLDRLGRRSSPARGAR